MKPKRYFIAISAQNLKNNEFFKALKKLKINSDKKQLEVKWSPPQNLHCTLKFIGHMDDETKDNLIQKIQNIVNNKSNFKLKVKSIGGFPEEIHARVLWLGVQNKIELRNLRYDIENCLTSLGHESDEQEFTPHITIGRLRNKKNIKDLISPFNNTKFGQLEVDKIVLYESFLQGHYPVYKIIHEFPINN